MASGIQSSRQGEQVATSLQLHSLEALVHRESIRAAQVWSSFQWYCHKRTLIIVGFLVVFYGDSDCSLNATRVPTDESCISRAQFLSFARPCGSESPPLPSASATHSIRSTTSPESVATSATSSSQASQPVPSTIPPEGSRTGGGLSTAGTIAIGVVLPAVSVIVAIIFGIRTWNRGFNLRRSNDFVDLKLKNTSGHSATPNSESSAGLVEDDGNGDAQESIRVNNI